MVDSDSLLTEQANDRAPESHILFETVAHPTTPFKICACSVCEDHIYRHAAKPKFSEYSKLNLFTVDELTDHQYFMCEMSVQAFAFKLRIWGESQVPAQQERRHSEEAG